MDNPVYFKPLNEKHKKGQQRFGVIVAYKNVMQWLQTICKSLSIVQKFRFILDNIKLCFKLNKISKGYLIFYIIHISKLTMKD